MAALALGLEDRRYVFRERHLLCRGLLCERSAGQREECADGDSQVELRTMHHWLLFSTFCSERLYRPASRGKTRTPQRHLGVRWVRVLPDFRRFPSIETGASPMAADYSVTAG